MVQSGKHRPYLNRLVHGRIIRKCSRSVHGVLGEVLNLRLRTHSEPLKSRAVRQTFHDDFVRNVLHYARKKITPRSHLRFLQGVPFCPVRDCSTGEMMMTECVGGGGAVDLMSAADCMITYDVCSIRENLTERHRIARARFYLKRDPICSKNSSNCHLSSSALTCYPVFATCGELGNTFEWAPQYLAVGSTKHAKDIL